MDLSRRRGGKLASFAAAFARTVSGSSQDLTLSTFSSRSILSPRHYFRVRLDLTTHFDTMTEHFRIRLQETKHGR